MVAFLLSLVVARPAMVRVGQLSAAMASLPEEQRAGRLAEVERLRRRSGLASIVAMALLIGAAAGMAVARYLGLFDRHFALVCREIEFAS
ncbi:MAG: hypothetical protein H7Z74_02945 [Anaerolineae bacterium]|nr:hypothetical protein [Gemmatimonadaceae bacterium]